MGYIGSHDRANAWVKGSERLANRATGPKGLEAYWLFESCFVGLQQFPIPTLLFYLYNLYFTLNNLCFFNLGGCDLRGPAIQQAELPRSEVKRQEL